MRTLRILVIAGLWHIAMAMGNLAAGLLLKYLTFVGLLAVSAGCHLLGLGYTLLFIQEKQEKKAVMLRSVLSFHRFYDGLAAVLRPREKGLRVVGCTYISLHLIFLLLVVVTIIFCSLLCEFTWGLRFMGINYYYIRANFPWPEADEVLNFILTSKTLTHLTRSQHFPLHGWPNTTQHWMCPRLDQHAI